MPNIDERVVEMQFDNKQFESGVRTSLNTLSALKKGLNLSGAAKGLGELEKAGNKFSLNGMATAIDHIANKFSVLGIAGITVIQDLTRSALAMAKSITSQFTIDPIETGFAEYETQINAVQTILANTQKEGTNLQQVNAALNELNKYADKTIYNFTEMTRNIGTFTAAGVKLDTAVNSIQGIANLAAISGSTSQQASTAMYQLSQAMASGTVKLMDWNSVVNAGMGGQVFQDALTETARVHGIKIDAMIKKQGSFRETLQEGWLTTEILTETLEKFTASTEGLTEAQIEQNKAMWKSRGYTDEQIDAIFEMGQMATEAATKVKTFSQLMDTLKEAAQSGWTQTWETVIGDFEEAKDLFTEISDTVGKMIGDSADDRNTRLFGGLASGWKQLLAQGIDDAAGFEEMVSTVAKEHGVTLDEWIKADGSFVKTLKRGWLNADILGESIGRFTDKLAGMSEEELKAAGYTAETVANMVALRDAIQNGEVSLDSFAKSIAGVSGREHLIQALRNSFQALMNIVTPIRTAFKNIFPPATSEQIYSMAEGISNFTKKLADGSAAISGKIQTVFEGFFSVISIGVKGFKSLISGAGDLTARLKPVAESLLNFATSIGEYLVGLNKSVDETNIFGRAVEKLTGFFGPLIDSASSLISGFFDNLPATVGKAVSTFFSFATKVREVFGKIGKAILNVFSGPDFFQGIANAFNTGILASILVGIKKFISSLTDTVEGGKGFLENLQGVFDGITGSLEAMQQSLKADTLLKIAAAVGILTVSLIALAFVDSDKLASSVVAIGVAMGELMLAMKAFTKITSGSKVSFKAAASLIAISTAVLILAAAVRTISKLNTDQLLTGLVGVGAALLMLSAIAKNTESGLSAKQTTGFILLAAAVVVLAQAVKQFSSMDAESMLSGLMGVGAVLVMLASFANSTANAKNVTSTAFGMVVLGAAMLVFGQAIKMVGSIPIPTLATGIIALATALYLIVGAVNLLPQKGMVGAGVGMLAISAALLILSTAIQAVGKMPFDQVATGLIGLGVSLLAIAATMQYMTNALPGAAALLVVAAAIRLFVPALESMGSMSIGSIAKGLITLALSLAVVGGAAALLAPIVPAMLGMAAAMALVGVAIMTISAGVALFSAALGTLATVGAVGAAAIVAALTTIVVGIIQLIPSICVAIGDGIVAIATTIGASAGAICSAVTAVVTAVVSALVSCIPLVVNGALQLVLSILVMLAVYAPQIATAGIQLVVGLINAVSEQMPALVNAGINLMVNFINGMADGVRDNSEVILSAVANLMSSIVEFALTALATLVSGIPGIGAELEAGILSMRDQVRATLAPGTMQETGAQAMSGMASGIATGAPEVRAAGESAASEGASGASSKDSEFTLAGSNAASSLIQGINLELPNANAAGEGLAGKGASGAASKDGEYRTSGSNAGAGFVDGLLSKWQESYNAGASLAGAANQGYRDKLDINSPSRVTRKSGGFAGKGFVLGVLDYAAKARDAGSVVATTSVAAMSNALSNMADYLSMNMDSVPTIRPVMDLSDVQSGIQAIGSMFSATRGIDVSPMTGSVSSAISKPNRYDRNAGDDSSEHSQTVLNFNQYNNSPKSLSRIEIYRQTHNILAAAKGALSKA